MLTCQKNKFSLPEGIHFLNCATMSPLSKAVEEAGIQGVKRKSTPYTISQENFFDTAEIVKSRFAKIIHCPDVERIVIMPSVSYGIAVVVKNIIKKIKRSSAQKIVLIGEEFPSDVYGWDELANEHQVKIETVLAPTELQSRGKQWNERVLHSIDDSTILLCISPSHWTDGTLFHLEALRDKCKQHNTLFIIDGTQHIGAYPFDITSIQPDFVICAVYKFLMGPYSNAIAYCGEFLDDGFSLEQNWTARVNSNEFKNLVNYQRDYRPKSFRYNMGEFSNFINLPMMATALEQIIEWTPESIQEYCKHLLALVSDDIKNAGYWIEEEGYRSAHLFGIKFPNTIDLDAIQKKFSEHNLYVSYRGNNIRTSLNVWNDEEDVMLLRKLLLEIVRK